MSYPSRGDLDTAVQNLQIMVKDPLLRQGKVYKNKAGMLEGYSGGFSRVYPIDTASGKYALRCWIGDIGDGEKRYEIVDHYLEKLAAPYFVGFAYIKEGVLVKGKIWPILRMDWTEGMDLKEYAGLHRNDKFRMEKLAEDFLEMAIYFHEKGIAHGDFQNENIRVKANGDLVLVDYDSLFVPGLENWDDMVKGYPSYQHPRRDDNRYVHAKVDYFSELIIYLGIKILAERPDFWDHYQLALEEKQFFFSAEDFRYLAGATRFKVARGLSPEIDLLLDALEEFCQVTDILDLWPLEEVLQGQQAEIEKFELEKIGAEYFICWSVKNADEIEINGLPEIEAAGKLNITALQATKIFTIRAINQNMGDPVFAELKVRIPKILTFTSDEYHVYDGKKINLFWEVKDALKITIKPLGDRSHQAVGQEQIIASASTDFVIEAMGDTRIIRQQLPLHFIKIPPIKLGPIPQATIPNLTIAFENKVSGLDFALPTQTYFESMKGASSILQDQLLKVSRPLHVGDLVKSPSPAPAADRYANLKNLVLSLKSKIYKDIDNQLIQ